MLRRERGQVRPLSGAQTRRRLGGGSAVARGNPSQTAGTRADWDQAARSGPILGPIDLCGVGGLDVHE